MKQLFFDHCYNNGWRKDFVPKAVPEFLLLITEWVRELGLTK